MSEIVRSTEREAVEKVAKHFDDLAAKSDGFFATTASHRQICQAAAKEVRAYAETLPALQPASLARESEPVEAPYVPTLVRNFEAGFVEFVERDVPSVVGQMFAANVEPVYDMATRILMGYRVYDTAITPSVASPALSKQADGGHWSDPKTFEEDPVSPSLPFNSGVEAAASMVAALRDDGRQEPMSFTEIAQRIRNLQATKGTVG